MLITYVLELLKPTNKKANLIEKNILAVQKNRYSISNKLSKGKNKLSTKQFNEDLPSAVINQNIREVKALYKRLKKDSNKENLSFKKNQPICFNNQNYRIDRNFVSFPLYNGRSSRYWFPVVENQVFADLNKQIGKGCKLGKSSLFRKNSKYYLAVTVTVESDVSTGNNIMGVDVGLNQLATVSIQNKHNNEISRSFFNGKEAGYVRRKYRALRRSLGKAKKFNKIKAIGDKESRYMTNLNHKVSRRLVNLAVQEKVSTLVMEDLKGIRKSYSSKKADKNINSWTFYELQQFIDYKAKLAGIEVVYINPEYTSQTCNECGLIKKSNRKRNLYKCSCGNTVHSDLNAARNICDIGLEAVNQQSA